MKSLIRSKSSFNSNTSNSDPTSAMSAKLLMPEEWKETFWARRDLFAPKKCSNLSPNILVEWMVNIAYRVDILELTLHSSLSNTRQLRVFLQQRAETAYCVSRAPRVSKYIWTSPARNISKSLKYIQYLDSRSSFGRRPFDLDSSLKLTADQVLAPGPSPRRLLAAILKNHVK